MNAATQSPFAKHAGLLLNFSQCYGALNAIRSVVVHLYNSANKANIAQALRNCDGDHRAMLFEFLHSYAEHGESDRIFLDVGRELVDAKKARKWRP